MDNPLKNRLRAFIEKAFSKGERRKGITEADLRQALLEGEKSGVVESKERTMVEGVFYLGDRPVSAFMTHRSEIKWLDINASPEEARKTVESAKAQLYFPVAAGDLDEIAGMVLIQEVYKALLDSEWPGLKFIMRPPFFVPETMSALKAFEAFKQADANALFVMDEYGGFAGILTVRNLIEEIVGELSASGEEDEEIIKQDDGTWLADGGVSIDDAARELELEKLGDEQNDYHTLAGFILYLAGEIPRIGASFDYKGYRFKVVDLDQNRIDKIMISRIIS
jgi:putative hemolysin